MGVSARVRFLSPVGKAHGFLVEVLAALSELPNVA